VRLRRRPDWDLGRERVRALLADPLLEATFEVIKAADIPAADRC